MSSLSQGGDLLVHPGSVINLVLARSSELGEQLRVNKAPSPACPLLLTIPHWLPSPPLQRFVAQQEVAKEEMLFA